MTSRFATKKYYTFPEIEKRLQCSKEDLIYLVIENEITPSYFVDQVFYSDHYVEEGENGFPERPTVDMNELPDYAGHRFKTQLIGFYFLVFPTIYTANSCCFSFISKKAQGHDVGDIVHWLDSGISLDSVRESGVIMASELSRFEALQVKNSLSVQVTKPLGTTERNILLTIIAALAKEAKINIDPPGKAAGYIEGLTALLGARVSKRAIEDHLKKIPDALGTRMK